MAEIIADYIPQDTPPHTADGTTDKKSSERRHLFLVKPFSGNGITSETFADMTTAVDFGHDVGIAQTSDGITLPLERQALVTGSITDLEEQYPVSGMVDFLMDPSSHPTAATWYSLAKRAIALAPLYSPNRSHLGSNIDPEVYHEPLFGGMSARQIIEKERSEKAPDILRKYFDFIQTPMDDGRVDRYGLTSAEYIAGVPDSIAVRLRAEAAGTMIVEHAVKTIAEAKPGAKYEITSLACGAAGPMFTIVPLLQAKGIDVRKVNLVDWDVMALATAKSLAKAEGMENIADIHRTDLLREDLSEKLKNTDAVDLLGLFEYFPQIIGKGPVRYNLAANFLRNVGRAMKPGAVIIFGNMLDSRPHQNMFNQVWPKLEQRSIRQVLSLIENAGFPPESVSVKVSPDGIYGIYQIAIPEKQIKLSHDSVAERISKWALLRFVKEY